ncbi:MAG TPA: hypothetical protein VGJ84_07970 [Polyangiaceae bacterium]|jgi:hypothetical protein
MVRSLIYGSSGCIVLALLLRAPSVFADAAADADALFKEAQRLSESGDDAAACQKFEESRKIANGLGVTMYLADCLQKTKHPARALELFREAEQMAKARKDKREKLAHERMVQLEPSVSTLELKLAGGQSAIEVLVDGQPVEPAQREQPLRLDPGSHSIQARAAGKRDFTANLQLEAGKTQTLEIPVLGDASEPAPAASAAKPNPALSADTSSSGFPRRTLGIALGGAGVVALGIGTFLGLQAKSKLSDSNNGHCDAQDFCDPRGLDLRRQANNAATISTVSFTAGLVLLGAGAFFFFTGGEEAPAGQTSGMAVAPVLSAREAGLVMFKQF